MNRPLPRRLAAAPAAVVFGVALAAAPAAVVFGVALAAALVPFPAAAQFSANQPFASYWFPNELLAWNPATDPDARHNRSAVPLRDRFTNPALQFNSHARDGEANIVALNVMYPSTSNNPSQGSAQFDVHAFGFWQYVDLLVFWGGSAGEGLILAPSADVIDSGHRNGVPVLGTIFFPPNVYGGQIAWVDDLLQKDGGTFPVADKLIEAAEYYGFDGWFLNQETAGGDSTTAAAMQEFLEYFQANKPAGMHMMWYDAMTVDGSIAWQNELNDENVMFFEDAGRVSDSIFLNFNWAFQSRLADSNARALAVGRSPYEVFAGVNVQALGYDATPNWPKLFPDSLPHVTSLGLFGGEWTYTSSTDPVDYYARQNTFWVGQNRDPALTSTPLSWKGMAHYVPAKSPVNDLPFVTNFNPGQGDFYAVEGEILGTEPWNNRSLQDVLPTWRWRTLLAPFLYPEIDFSDAYEGGACLKLSENLGTGEMALLLYKTSLPLSSDSYATITYKTGAVGPSGVGLRIALASDPYLFFELPADSATTTGWNTATIDLSAYASETIVGLGLEVGPVDAFPGHELRIGRLGIFDGPPAVPAPPANAAVSDVIVTPDRAFASLRLTWDPSPDPTGNYYVYRRNPDATRTFLGGTPSDALFLAEIPRVAAETTAVLEIEAISPGFGRSAPGTTSVFWGYDPPNELPIANADGPYCGPPGVDLAFHSDGTHDPDGTISGYDWRFGDGDSSSAADPSHAYALPGVYEVVLTVTDDGGRTDSDTTSATISTTAPDPVPDRAWYPLDEGFGSVAGDSSGLGHDGTIVGTIWLDGVDGGALFFDGDEDYVIVPDHPAAESTLTVTAWAWAPSRPEWGSIVKNWGGNPGSFHLGLHGTDGDLQAWIGEADGGVVELREGASVPLPLGTWQHVALVADGAEARLYRNGLEVDRAPCDGNLLSTRPGLGIGVKLRNNGTGPNNTLPSYWVGMLDDIRIWDRPLCQTEIETLAAAAATVAPDPSPAGLPTAFALGRNSPNPFGPLTEIRYAVARATRVTLVVYDVTGRKVADLVDEWQEPGSYRVRWRGRDRAGHEVAAGVYFTRMVADDFASVRKMLVLR